MSLTRFSHTRRDNNPRSGNNRSNQNSFFFLTPGFQPTSITGDNIGFYQGSTFYDGAPPNVLPTLNASPILSPGKYVRQSSWSATSRHYLNTKKNNNGAKSGTAAALRLVDARREFMSLMKKELLGTQQHNTNDESEKVAIENDVRKLYALEGHGVPMELLSHLIQMVRGWTAPPPQSLGTQTQNSSSVVQISFQNVPNSTLLNRDEIQVIHANGYTIKLTENDNHMLNYGGDDWEHDFDLYMVVMDRIASRLASFALFHPTPPHHYDSGTSTAFDRGGDYSNGNNEAALGSSGSVITPASLQRWNVTMMEGEALPLTLLPIRRRERQSSSIVLTVEWVLNNKRGRNDCCNIVLRLQDDGIAGTDSDDGRGRAPISLVFDGVYV